MPALQLQTPQAATSLAGIAIPLSMMTVAGDPNAQAVLWASVREGTLGAEPQAGGSVLGAGGAALWMSGTVAQLDAMLATLSYRASVVGTDTLTLRLSDALGRALQTASVAVDALPIASPGSAPRVIEFGSGTVTLNQCTLAGVALDVDAAGSHPAIVLSDATIGANAAISLRSQSGGDTARLAISGRVENNGSVTAADGSATISVARDAVLHNDGSLRLAGAAPLVTGAGTLQNDGAITVASGNATVATAITGEGTISLEAGAVLTLAGPVARGQTIALHGHVTLVLADAAEMAATIVGGDATDHIIVQGPQDLPGPGSALGSAIATSQATVMGGANPLWRFFDTKNGTELLTADRGEHDTILQTRPDLVQERSTLMTLGGADAAQPGNVAIYRFFDTAHGNHFFTASDTERDALVQTRPDLVLEPQSTIYEHGTPGIGDVAVYRFFDTATGAHFYTGDAAERAALLQTRPDMKSEGIAFYAPSA